MHPCTPQQVNHRRSVAVSIIRTASVSLMVWGAYLMLKRILFGIAQQSWEMAFTAYEGVGEEHSFYRGLSMAVVAVLLACFADRIARWLVPVPFGGCPRCGYEKIDNDRCPECGLGGFAPPRAP